MHLFIRTHFPHLALTLGLLSYAIDIHSLFLFPHSEAEVRMVFPPLHVLHGLGEVLLVRLGNEAGNHHAEGTNGSEDTVHHQFVSCTL